MATDKVDVHWNYNGKMIANLTKHINYGKLGFESVLKSTKIQKEWEPKITSSPFLTNFNINDMFRVLLRENEWESLDFRHKSL